MELGFKILEFWAFDQILGLGPVGLPAPAHLGLGEVEETQTMVSPFGVYVMIEKTAIARGACARGRSQSQSQFIPWRRLGESGSGAIRT